MYVYYTLHIHVCTFVCMCIYIYIIKDPYAGYLSFPEAPIFNVPGRRYPVSWPIVKRPRGVASMANGHRSPRDFGAVDCNIAVISFFGVVSLIEGFANPILTKKVQEITAHPGQPGSRMHRTKSQDPTDTSLCPEVNIHYTKAPEANYLDACVPWIPLAGWWSCTV